MQDVQRKVCVDCQQEKTLSDYYKQSDQLDGLKHSCKTCSNIKTTEWRLAKRQQWNAKNKAYRDRIRATVLEHYQNMCACCADTHVEFLGIDHIEGGGNKHRKSLRGTNFYKWLIEHKFPPGFQVLCHSCNMAKAFYGECPHVQELQETNPLALVGGC